jgi:FtsH-binding integral membrane protein
LASLGLGASGFAFLGGLSKYRSLFVILTGIMLAAGYWLMESKNTSKSSKIVYWISAVLAIFMLYLPTILSL